MCKYIYICISGVLCAYLVSYVQNGITKFPNVFKLRGYNCEYIFIYKYIFVWSIKLTVYQLYKYINPYVCLIMWLKLNDFCAVMKAVVHSFYWNNSSFMKNPWKTYSMNVSCCYYWLSSETSRAQINSMTFYTLKESKIHKWLAERSYLDSPRQTRTCSGGTGSVKHLMQTT